jgi:RNA polymerase sigma factor (sigma-70 family)
VAPPLDETHIAQQFQFEIPRKPIHRQFNVHVGQCRQCQRRVQGRHRLQTSDALGAAAAQLGPDAQAAIVELNKQGGLSLARQRLDVLAVHEALERLAAFHERQSQVVTLRFFGGFTVEEVAELLGMSVSTVESDFRIARAWLHSRLG